VFTEEVLKLLCVDFIWKALCFPEVRDCPTSHFETCKFLNGTPVSYAACFTDTKATLVTKQIFCPRCVKFLSSIAVILKTSVRKYHAGTVPVPPVNCSTNWSTYRPLLRTVAQLTAHNSALRLTKLIFRSLIPYATAMHI